MESLTEVFCFVDDFCARLSRQCTPLAKPDNCSFYLSEVITVILKARLSNIHYFKRFCLGF